ncbi:MAG TPA: DUF5916 domain-containing protein [Gemmatimonadota bacterium]|nr:DUF5916 domain-containing protein [Gemmatimonadota bacterium]
MALLMLTTVAFAQPLPDERSSAEQTPVPPPKGGDRLEVEAVRIRSGTPQIDGRLDEEVWQSARWIADFVQKEPDQGQPAEAQTEIAFLFDDGALYIGARMQSGGSRISDLMTRRDEPGNAERLIVSLDTYLDRRTAYTFAVTAAGVRLDYFHPFDNEHQRDYTFDPVWETRTEIGEDGWTAEMRIPFSQLRFNDAQDLVWGVNVNRYVPASNEDSYLVLIPREETGWASRFADLVGLQSIPASRRIEITPYLASSAKFTSEALFDADDPFRDGSDLDARVGVDFKMGLGSNLTLDAAVNPDFGQVEADPAEVNLSAFETFFEERRPFFTEGQQNFQGNGPSYFYSRRIGASPHGQADGDFVDTPNTTTILGAAKLTGRLPSGLTVGALGAITDEEQARAFDVVSKETRDVRVEPLTSYGVVRLQQQFGDDASTIGLTLTGMKRDVDAGDPLASILTENAFTGGLDWNKRFNGGEYELLGHAGYSWVGGDSLAIARVQQRSTHYFQRPDAPHVEFDPSRTSLSGWSAAVRGGKRSGTWTWNGGLWLDSPGFEVNDVGRLNRADNVNNWANLSYNDREPGTWLRRWNVGLFQNANWNFDGVHRFQNLGFYTNYTLTNFWNGFFEHGWDLPTMSDNATRGGPLMELPGGWWVAGGIFSNQNEPTRYGIRSHTWQDGLGGWVWQIDPEFTTQPTDRLTLTIQPRYMRRHEPRQFITSRSGGLDATFGRRYLFGLIDRTEIATPVRANFSFTPDLSLELYAEPFAASGRYSDIGELAAPRTHDLRIYGEAEGTGASRDEESGDWTFTDGDAEVELGNPDFDVLSFRSNLVMRWEWRPGSTFFLVWQQNRSAADDEGRFVRAGDLYDTLGADGENVLAVKFTYWLPL